ncbi:hypothetical protein BWK62_12080 [Flavobacterium oreochromis]|uniref:Lipoprotein n=2 Tax=Flavobacterium TaxID=237 RepID=A0A246GAR4_9FLAO|nr:hypothetical protein BWK62_12080 [Flavobacterium oreochromis]
MNLALVNTMKIKFINILAVLTTLFFASCSVESIDPVLPKQINNDTNSNPNGVVVDYWPSVVNNNWTYTKKGVAQTPMKVMSTEVLRGKTYYTFNNLFGQSASVSAKVTMQLRKNNGDYYLRVPGFTADLGTTGTAQSTEFEYLLFKDYVNLNDTWTSNFTQTFTYSNPVIPSVVTSTVIDGTMLGKDTSIVVNGVTFNNVIKFKVIQKTTVLMQVTTTTTYYWYAKGVGCVKSIIQNTGTSDTVSELQTYNLF